jgi:hypothetical protein
MVETTQQILQAQGTSSFLRLAPTLRSKLAFTEIMSFAFTYEEVCSKLIQLCKAGKEFITKNPEQLRSFCLS